jgi:hypothetical protein
MNEMTLDQNEEELFTYEVSDDRSVRSSHQSVG